MKRRALAAGLLLAACSAPASIDSPRLQYITTAQQFGPVSFRDPLGVLSPDGEWLAFSVQNHLYVQRVSGGPVRLLPEKPGLILHLVWSPDSRAVATQHRFSSPGWWLYDRDGDPPGPLWPGGHSLKAAGDRSAAVQVLTDSLRQIAWTRDGSRVAGIRDTKGGSELWTFNPAGDSAQVAVTAERMSFPVWAPDGHVACLSNDGKRQVLSDPCGRRVWEEVPAFGPIAFSYDGGTLYYAAPDSGGTLDLWRRAASGGSARRLTTFSRDSYAPTAARNGAVLFKLQTYRTVVGVVDAGGGAVTPIAAFQSETPSWDPSGRWIGITYGTWRRVVDDFRYPDIAQDAGIISADPDSLPKAPVRIVDASPSEDQSMGWSPNGKWIAYHSHKDLGDDIYLVPADGSAPARRITSFGRGFETGWPRWSPDGKWIAFDADSRESSRKSVIYVIGVDQNTGQVTSPEREVRLDGFTGEAVHAEWLPGSDRLAVLGEVANDLDALLVVGSRGGSVRTVHQWRTEHRFAGLGVSPDGKFLAFIAPAPDTRFQLFRIAMSGGTPEQLTFDPSNKTQPAYSPDGKRIALTVWEYQVSFWILQ